MTFGLGKVSVLLATALAAAEKACERTDWIGRSRRCAWSGSDAEGASTIVLRDPLPTRGLAVN